MWKQQGGWMREKSYTGRRRLSRILPSLPPPRAHMINRLLSARDYEVLNRVGALLDEARHLGARATRACLIEAKELARDHDVAVVARVLVYHVFRKLLMEFAPRNPLERALADQLLSDSPDSTAPAGLPRGVPIDATLGHRAAIQA